MSYLAPASFNARNRSLNAALIFINPFQGKLGDGQLPAVRDPVFARHRRPVGPIELVGIVSKPNRTGRPRPACRATSFFVFHFSSFDEPVYLTV